MASSIYRYPEGKANHCPACGRAVEVLEYRPGVVRAVVHEAPWCESFEAAVTRSHRPIRTLVPVVRA
jgi:hypothetical protein